MIEEMKLVVREGKSIVLRYYHTDEKGGWMAFICDYGEPEDTVTSFRSFAKTPEKAWENVYTDYLTATGAN